jgi:hexosaminidase
MFTTMSIMVVVVLCAAAVEAAAVFPPIWPMPKSFTNGTGVVAMDPRAFSMSLMCVANNTNLTNSFQRFVDRAFPHQVSAAPAGALTGVTVCLDDGSIPLELYMNESYQLNVDGSGIMISCRAVYGCYHALETLSQMISFDFDTQTYSVLHAPWSINDAPRFPHRGILIDTSRHFLPVATIKKIIDSVTYAKFNAIHWHIVDAIAFPFDSVTYPQLGKYGAYSPEERFTHNDISEVVAYAAERGIRVMVELDTPGHSGSMCYGMPEICPSPGCPSNNINNWALDITKNETYTVVGDLFAELSGLFPEKMTHLGGDEVDTYCWSLHPYIVNWLSERGLSLEGGYEYYVKRIQAIVWSLNRMVVGWQEIWDHFGTQLDNRTIIHQWLPDSISLPLNVTSHGYRLIWSDSSVWYLDHLAVDWETMYKAEPCNGLPDENCLLILGGEGCQWGETVDTSDALQTIWPRAAAIAERLWSPRNYNSSVDATDRFVGFRCLLNHRGVAAAPADNAVARQPPPYPGSCYNQ